MLKLFAQFEQCLRVLSELLLFLFGVDEFPIFSKFFKIVRRDPSWVANIVNNLGGSLLHLWQQLDCGRTITNDSDPFVRVIIILVPVSSIRLALFVRQKVEMMYSPIGGMHQSPLELIHAFNSRPRPFTK